VSRRREKLAGAECGDGLRRVRIVRTKKRSGVQAKLAGVRPDQTNREDWGGQRPNIPGFDRLDDARTEQRDRGDLTYGETTTQAFLAELLAKLA